ncbi:microfibril-associated glycoprotein 4-like [Asterias amurensis]|uniref:microfibril-associated glycoprotein 4-like n=1 Tax=Asterias amurensis TaxID=7602 RepID=UPI003AB13451
MKSLSVCANHVVFMVVITSWTVESQYTTSERRMFSAENRALKGFGYKTKTATNHVICGRDCSIEIDCKSFNFYDDQICDLNNATRDKFPESFIVDRASVYFDTNDETSLLALDDYTLNNFKTCSTLLDAGYNKSAVYTIYPNGFTGGVQVFCDMDAEGRGWIVFQRRLNGSVDYYRTWTEYQSGFGDLSAEFWLGNDNLVSLTSDSSNGTWELQVDLVDGNNVTAWGNYKEFKVLSETYVLNIGEYDEASTIGDSLKFHNGLPFTTKDRDNDIRVDENCAVSHEGGWWYRRCAHCDLNGRYSPFWKTVDGKGIVWKTWGEGTESLKTTSMKMRQTNK